MLEILGVERATEDGGAPCVGECYLVAFKKDGVADDVWVSFEDESNPTIYGLYSDEDKQPLIDAARAERQ